MKLARQQPGVPPRDIAASPPGRRLRASPRQHCAVVELGLVDHHVRVGVRGDGEVSLSDLLADLRPRHAAKVLALLAPAGVKAFELATAPEGV